MTADMCNSVKRKRAIILSHKPKYTAYNLRWEKRILGIKRLSDIL